MLYICHSECAVAQIQRLAARVRELERDREAAALAMREKCALVADNGNARAVAAAVRALEE